MADVGVTRAELKGRVDEREAENAELRAVVEAQAAVIERLEARVAGRRLRGFMVERLPPWRCLLRFGRAGSP